MYHLVESECRRIQNLLDACSGHYNSLNWRCLMCWLLTSGLNCRYFRVHSRSWLVCSLQIQKIFPDFSYVVSSLFGMHFLADHYLIWSPQASCWVYWMCDPCCVTMSIFTVFTICAYLNKCCQWMYVVDWTNSAQVSSRLHVSSLHHWTSRTGLPTRMRKINMFH